MPHGKNRDNYRGIVICHGKPIGKKKIHIGLIKELQMLMVIL